MATYDEIAARVKKKHGPAVKTCWIADRKDAYGLIDEQRRVARGKKRKNPCPPDKAPMIDAAMRHFGMIG